MSPVTACCCGGGDTPATACLFPGCTTPLFTGTHTWFLEGALHGLPADHTITATLIFVLVPPSALWVVQSITHDPPTVLNNSGNPTPVAGAYFGGSGAFTRFACGTLDSDNQLFDDQFARWIIAQQQPSPPTLVWARIRFESEFCPPAAMYPVLNHQGNPILPNPGVVEQQWSPLTIA